MKPEKILEAIKAIPGGRFFRVRYMTKVKMNAESVKNGITVIKIVDTTTRTGVKYKNIAGVVLNEYPDSYVPKVSNWEWVIPQRVKHNSKTGKDYLVIAPIAKGHNTHVSYVLTDGDGNSRVITKEEAKEYSVASYWKDGDKPAIMNVTLENVLMVK
jgi:hypothetical protein